MGADTEDTAGRRGNEIMQLDSSPLRAADITPDLKKQFAFLSAPTPAAGCQVANLTPLPHRLPQNSTVVIVIAWGKRLKFPVLAHYGPSGGEGLLSTGVAVMLL
ncbi:hypothetical protein INR49_010218 [Caranx melampygus]|nr:hypothetical protein INR49_010218 [Caranx melampygus]